jgi:hypothetical protein
VLNRGCVLDGVLAALLMRPRVLEGDFADWQKDWTETVKKQSICLVIVADAVGQCHMGILAGI